MGHNSQLTHTKSASFSQSVGQTLDDPTTDILYQENLQKLYRRYAVQACISDVREFHMLDKKLDSQLLFSGIFSAVVTPLLAETYEMLKPDRPTSRAILINAMFFGALLTSLCTAIMSFQFRTWMHGYDVDQLQIAHEEDNLDDLMQVCRLRQYRRQNLDRWGARYAIMTAGPCLTYLSFTFFFIGLISFLLELHIPTAIALIVVLSLFMLAHLVTSVIPAFDISCPFKTPLSATIGFSYRAIRKGQIPSPKAGLNERDEALEVDRLETELDTEILVWLKNTAPRSEKILAAQILA